MRPGPFGGKAGCPDRRTRDDPQQMTLHWPVIEAAPLGWREERDRPRTDSERAGQAPGEAHSPGMGGDRTSSAEHRPAHGNESEQARRRAARGTERHATAGAVMHRARAAMNRRPPISPVSTATEIARRSSSGDQPTTVVHPDGDGRESLRIESESEVEDFPEQQRRERKLPLRPRRRGDDEGRGGGDRVQS